VEYGPGLRHKKKLRLVSRTGKRLLTRFGMSTRPEAILNCEHLRTMAGRPLLRLPDQRSSKVAE